MNMTAAHLAVMIREANVFCDVTFHIGNTKVNAFTKDETEYIAVKELLHLVKGYHVEIEELGNIEHCYRVIVIDFKYETWLGTQE